MQPDPGRNPGTPFIKNYRSVIVSGAIILVSIIIRVPGLFSDFWLDEIWALNIVRSASSFSSIFTGIHFDTNHWLYSVFMYTVRSVKYWPIYRIPSFLAGILSLFLIGAIMKPRGWRATIISLILAGGSYFLVIYSSEARGYSMAIFWGLLGFYSMQRFTDTETQGWVPVLALSCFFGFLSHLTFIFIFGSLIFWSGLYLLRKKGGLKEALLSVASWYLFPVLSFIVLYLVDIRHIEHGGGEVWTVSGILSGSLALFLGQAGTGTAGIINGTLLMCIVIFCVVRISREDAGKAVFYASTLFIFPELFYLYGIWSGFEYWDPRHLVICLPFVILLLARFIDWCWDKGRTGRTVALLILIVYMAGNASCIEDMIRFGRGHYLEALRYMVKETKGKDITIASDHDFRNKMLLTFYADYIPEDVVLRYYEKDSWPTDPDWYITHWAQKAFFPFNEIRSPKGRDYVLKKHFPYGGISGWHWAVYRRVQNAP